jgi:hypothetical protein
VRLHSDVRICSTLDASKIAQVEYKKDSLARQLCGAKFLDDCFCSVAAPACEIDLGIACKECLMVWTTDELRKASAGSMERRLMKTRTRAVSFPIPAFPPVIRMVLPERSEMSFSVHTGAGIHQVARTKDTRSVSIARTMMSAHVVPIICKSGGVEAGGSRALREHYLYSDPPQPDRCRMGCDKTREGR